MRLQWQIQRGRYEGYIPHENAMRDRDRETEMWKEVIFFQLQIMQQSPKHSVNQTRDSFTRNIVYIFMKQRPKSIYLIQ